MDWNGLAILFSSHKTMFTLYLVLLYGEITTNPHTCHRLCINNIHVLGQRCLVRDKEHQSSAACLVAILDRLTKIKEM